MLWPLKKLRFYFNSETLFSLALLYYTVNPCAMQCVLKVCATEHEENVKGRSGRERQQPPSPPPPSHPPKKGGDGIGEREKENGDRGGETESL